ncbi:hypothetical protein KAR91_32770 [Candidatus Pacearchaeota archaeon]|nr:hypothetical protein [Candidatus Pacearchaeota archaeon]
MPDEIVQTDEEKQALLDKLDLTPPDDPKPAETPKPDNQEPVPDRVDAVFNERVEKQKEYYRRNPDELTAINEGIFSELDSPVVQGLLLENAMLQAINKHGLDETHLQFIVSDSADGIMKKAEALAKQLDLKPGKPQPESVNESTESKKPVVPRIPELPTYDNPEERQSVTEAKKAFRDGINSNMEQWVQHNEIHKA